MTVQIPAFKANIADQMAAYRERLAERIDKELQRRGQDHHDLAHALRANPRTAERWVTGETEPQRRYRKPIADFFGVPIEDFWPELELEDKAFKDWMERIEANQDKILGELAAIRLELARPSRRQKPRQQSQRGKEASGS